MKHDDKKKIMKDHGRHAKDTGSPEVQIAILTARIKFLSDHLKLHPKDEHSRRGLLRQVGDRRKLINYLKTKKKEVYTVLIEKLGLRK
ncbi:30S ribosomal protein S15 [Candidatus Peregrinibacteria bacterium RIFOXYB2_FULL_32_7]|nr:MAG: 30S ribosomal protein S15 [Candidatus Peregrinibacteria bacterium RIFOXYB2_FULL_32_7]